ENRRWLSGVKAHDASPTATAGWLIVTQTEAVLVTSFLYYGAAVAEADAVSVVEIPQTEKLHQTAAAQLERLGVKRLGFEEPWFLESHMRQHGAEGMAFGPDVSGGPNAAVPHHSPSDRPIEAGEPIVIDIGAVIDGYRSDITRTVLLGRPDDQYRRIWNEVLEAQKRVLDRLRPGQNGREVDAIARDYLGSAGLGDAFGHGLGHGGGVQIHDDPRLAR